MLKIIMIFISFSFFGNILLFAMPPIFDACPVTIKSVSMQNNSSCSNFKILNCKITEGSKYFEIEKCPKGVVVPKQRVKFLVKNKCNKNWSNGVKKGKMIIETDQGDFPIELEMNFSIGGKNKKDRKPDITLPVGTTYYSLLLRDYQMRDPYAGNNTGDSTNYRFMIVMIKDGNYVQFCSITGSWGGAEVPYFGQWLSKSLANYYTENQAINKTLNAVKNAYEKYGKLQSSSIDLSYNCTPKIDAYQNYSIPKVTKNKIGSLVRLQAKFWNFKKIKIEYMPANINGNKVIGSPQGYLMLDLSNLSYPFIK